MSTKQTPKSVETKVEELNKDETKVVEKTDEKYKDEGADLVIISSDNVRFYVRKYYVQAASSVFRDMIQDCTNGPSEIRLVDNIIEKSTIIQWFLDLACGNAFADFDALPWLKVFDLLKFCDKYDCKMPLQTIRLLVSRPVESKTTVIIYRFYFACIVDDVETACRLLPAAARNTWEGPTPIGPRNCIQGEGCLDLTATAISWMERLPRKYFYALLRATKLRMAQPPASWELVAKDFKEHVKLQEATPAKAA